MIKNPTTRFSNRVNNYLKYRPHYPTEIINYLKQSIQFNKNQVVADIGSGTGFLTKLFLENGNTTYGVEPNAPMRSAAEIYLEDYNNFISIDGTAEASTLPDQSIDIISVAQAFHWFDVPKTKKEFLRILKPNGLVVLVWNQRQNEASDFMKVYLQFIKTYSSHSRKVTESRINKNIFQSVFGASNYKTANFPNYQCFDLQGLIGRYLSSSYSFAKDHPQHQRAINDLVTIFHTFQENGQVQMIYQTNLYYNSL